MAPVSAGRSHDPPRTLRLTRPGGALTLVLLTTPDGLGEPVRAGPETSRRTSGGLAS
ncbi:hypothetical protein [Streptomyces sp. NPDC088249]|uniref:hypothetical protein n=1 Tax=Streptomyces sp. NPDC088249 TaxID=3365843 RepID=UPI0037FF5494